MFMMRILYYIIVFVYSFNKKHVDRPQQHITSLLHMVGNKVSYYE